MHDATLYGSAVNWIPAQQFNDKSATDIYVWLEECERRVREVTGIDFTFEAKDRYRNMKPIDAGSGNELAHDIVSHMRALYAQINDLGREISDLEDALAEKLPRSLERMQGTTSSQMEHRTLTFAVEIDEGCLDEIDKAGRAGVQKAIDHVSRMVASDLVHRAIRARYDGRPGRPARRTPE